MNKAEYEPCLRLFPGRKSKESNDYDAKNDKQNWVRVSGDERTKRPDSCAGLVHSDFEHRELYTRVKCHN